eukprot:s10072_g1.t1
MDSVTPLVGWDVLPGESNNVPVTNLEETDFYEFLLERGAESAFRRLTALGVQEASDLQFLYEEDLVEFGSSGVEHSIQFFSGSSGVEHSSQFFSGHQFDPATVETDFLFTTYEDYAEYSLRMQQMWDQAELEESAP